jgi:tetratricopeptide (TPR) repeat protein
MKIALSIITKGDEELENLKKCVASFLPAVDGVFITANGKKTEKTKVWCKENGFNYSYLAWNDDFSEQRNFNFSQIKGFDMIVWTDSDDILVGADKLREVAEISYKNGFDCVFFTYYYGCLFNGEPTFENIKHVDLIQKRERLLKPGVFVWKGRLHETPVPIDNYQPRYTYVPYSKDYPIVWLHTEADRDPKTPKNIERMERNKRILELQLKEEREKGQADPRTLIYLMKIYVELEDRELWHKCIEMGYEYLSKSGWDEERAVCYQLMSKCYSQLGDNKKAEEAIRGAIKEYPYEPLLYLYLAKYLFNQGKYNEMEHWLKIAVSMEEKDASQMNNEMEKKILGAELTFKFEYYVKRDIRKAYRAIKYLYDVSPTKDVYFLLEEVKRLKELDEACEQTHKLIKYLEDKDKEEQIIPLIQSLPTEITNLEFAYHYFNKYKKPRVWKKNEICYYAYLGQHFEKWSPLSLKTGIGGSETAVIKLSKEWAKKGYVVVVYADVEKEGVYDNVIWLPGYKFNPRDRFNIFIQWRSSSLAGKIKAKKFLVDLHDLYSPKAINWDKIDYVFAKSEYHKSLAGKENYQKIKVISNGI